MNQTAQTLPDGYIAPPAPKQGAVPNQQQGQFGSALPPAGYTRDEELKRRTDQLQEQAETYAPEVETINPRKLEPINEIMQKFDENTGQLLVSNRDPAFEYCWVNASSHGIFITTKKAVGWQVVQGDMPEASEHKQVSTVRQVGDVILMRIPKELHQKLRERDFNRAMAQREGVSADLIEKAQKYGARVSIEGVTGDQQVLNAAAVRAQARTIANQQMDNMIRSGNVPGMPVRHR